MMSFASLPRLSQDRAAEDSERDRDFVPLLQKILKRHQPHTHIRRPLIVQKTIRFLTSREKPS